MMRYIAFVLLIGAAAALPGFAETAPIVEGPAGMAVPPGLRLVRSLGKIMVGVSERKLIVYDIGNPKAPLKTAEREFSAAIVDVRFVDGVLFVVLAKTEVTALAVDAAGALREYQAVAQQPAGAPASDSPAVPVAPVAENRPVASAASPETKNAGAEKTKQTIGRVAKVHRGTVLIEFDSAITIRPGDTLLVRSQGTETKLNMFSGREEQVISNAPIAVLEVRHVQGQRGVAELPRGDQANVGDTVELTDRPARTGTLYAPRVGYSKWLRATIRPFPNTGAVDFGSLTDIAFGYYWEFLHVQARVAPVGISVPHDVNAYNIHAVVAYQNDLAEFGIGGGYFSHKFEGDSEFDCDRAGYAVALSADGANGATRFNCNQQGPAFAQYLRLGSADGLHIRLSNTLAIDRGKFRFGYLEGSIDLPLTRSFNLFAAGGGSAGLKWGEAGMRTYLRGVGGSETLILTTGVGATSMRTTETFGRQQGSTSVGGVTLTEFNEGESSVGGLHIAVGLELRL